jgi:hypothetical protein
MERLHSAPLHSKHVRGKRCLSAVDIGRPSTSLDLYRSASPETLTSVVRPKSQTRSEEPELVQRKLSGSSVGTIKSCRAQSAVPRDTLRKYSARGKLELQDKGHVLMSILNDGKICCTIAKAVSGTKDAMSLSCSDALEIYDSEEQSDGNREFRRKYNNDQNHYNWAKRGRARSVGVKALLSLAARHTEVVAEKELSEAVAREAIQEKQRKERTVEQLQGTHKLLVSNLRTAQAKQSQAEARLQVCLASIFESMYSMTL